jgi:hypothetical protein
VKFACKARSLPWKGIPEMCSTQIGSGLTRKYLTGLERYARDKHSHFYEYLQFKDIKCFIPLFPLTLLHKNDEGSRFYNILHQVVIRLSYFVVDFFEELVGAFNHFFNRDSAAAVTNVFKKSGPKFYKTFLSLIYKCL